MVELVDTGDSKSPVARHAGSSPAWGTEHIMECAVTEYVLKPFEYAPDRSGGALFDSAGEDLMLTVPFSIGQKVQLYREDTRTYSDDTYTVKEYRDVEGGHGIPAVIVTDDAGAEIPVLYTMCLESIPMGVCYPAREV